MIQISKIIANRKIGFWLQTAAAVIAFVASIYYVIQSNIDKCFNSAFFILMLIGVACAVVQFFLRFDFLTLIAGIAWGVSLGIMVNNMLPTMSDVWNGVHFIGGNLTAYIVYTVFAFVCAVLGIVACFWGTEKESKVNS